MNALQSLVDILEVSPQGDACFIGRPGPGEHRIYGGLTITHALDAARQCCPGGFEVQSLHGQFLRPGDHQQDVDIRVETLKDGRRFKLYNVYCSQQGNTIFFATATFHQPEPSFEHDLKTPELLLPDADTAMYYPHRQQAYSPAEWTQDNAALEVRMAQKNESHLALEPENITWLKTVAELPMSDWQQTLLLAYASDWNMPSIAMRPHKLEPEYGENMASLDHAIWFYRQANLHDWIAYVQDSPAALNSRGHSRGLIYNRQGDLLACVSQESFLSRYRKSDRP